MWQLPLTKFNVGYCKKLDVNATMDMIVQSFPGLTELGLAGLEMEALPEGVIPKCCLKGFGVTDSALVTCSHRRLHSAPEARPQLMRLVDIAA